jgi:hypothetical protein
MTYEVQTLTFLNNWQNTWTNDGVQPTQFDTYAEAAAELAGFLEDMQYAAANNFLLDYNASDYRIKKL